jgi:hypothetical protein
VDPEGCGDLKGAVIFFAAIAVFYVFESSVFARTEARPI